MSTICFFELENSLVDSQSSTLRSSDLSYVVTDVGWEERGEKEMGGSLWMLVHRDQRERYAGPPLEMNEGRAEAKLSRRRSFGF
jgi:hypothetical protein